MKDVRHPEDFLPLKPNWSHVLLYLVAQDQHGYGIMQEVLERTGSKVHLWPTLLYGTLKKLVEVELVEESDARPTPKMDDARRGRYYRLTRLGRRVLTAEGARLEELVQIFHSRCGVNRDKRSPE